MVRVFYCQKPSPKTAQGKEGSTILIYAPGGSRSPYELKTLIEQSLDADKALDIVTIDLADQSALADYMIVASGTSSRHIQALAEKIGKRLSARGYKNIRMEGMTQGDWVVLDAGDVIVQLFRPEVRNFYNIEKMWHGGAPAYLTEQVLA